MVMVMCGVGGGVLVIVGGGGDVGGVVRDVY